MVRDVFAIIGILFVLSVVMMIGIKIADRFIKRFKLNFKEEIKMQKIRIKYFGETTPLEKIQKGDWIDLRAREDVILGLYGVYKIPLGVAMELPKGYEAHIVPRSSTFKKWGVIQTNHMGVIDGSYCGDEDEWSMEVMCLKTTDFMNGSPCTIIHKGDRICQFRIMENQPEIEFEEVEVLGNDNRGGYGSTGNN